MPRTDLDRGFNAAVLHVTGRLFPKGPHFIFNARLPADVLDLCGGDEDVARAFCAWRGWCNRRCGAPGFPVHYSHFGATRLQAEHLRDLFGAERSEPWALRLTRLPLPALADA